MGKPPLILVVDDDAVTRLMLCRFLARNGYSTVEAGNGEEAVTRFAAHRPEMVLMDARMPVLDGFGACARIKARPDGAHTPVLMITGLNDDESVDRAFDAGAVDFITKPIHWAILRNRMSYLLQMVQAQRELYLAGSVFESTSEGIVVTDPRAVIQSVNPAFERITGYVADEVVGQKMNILRSGRHDRKFYERMWHSLTTQHKWQGEVWNRRKNGEIFPEWVNISAIRGAGGETFNYVAVFTDLTAMKESEENLIFITGHDSLTGLPNRLLFNERIIHAINETKRHEGQVAVMLLDLDRFKMINDTVGHDVGDRLLIQAAERISGCVPTVCTLARLGGDEFGVVFPQLPHIEDAAHVAQAILDELAAPFELDQMELFIGGSLGISIYPLDGQDAKTLLKNADAAMYHAKEQGRNNYQYYRNELNASSLARILLESSLRTALDKQEFLLHYQPQVDLASGTLVGMESLVRWRHPERGMVSPKEFIPLCEETGLIIPLGEWALRSACRQARSWQEQGFPPLRVAVNLSGIQFKNIDLAALVTRVLEESGLEPRFLELELTESIAMEHVEETLAKLQALAHMGIKLAIDDFGTGFSSLSYLKRYPIHTLKIDQSFVRSCTSDADDAAIIRTVIGLAHTMNLSVIAEGVETTDQLEFLRQNDCDEIQGYLYSRPLAVEDFTRLLQEQRIPLRDPAGEGTDVPRRDGGGQLRALGGFHPPPRA